MRRSALPALAALFATSCASFAVNADFDPTIDFGTYRTFAWGPRDALPTGDPRFDNNPFFDNRTRAEVEAQLVDRGYAMALQAQADLLVHYHIVIRERVDMYSVDRDMGYQTGTDTAMREYEEGTLMIDLVDARTKRVIWRGWALSDMTGVLNNQDALIDRIHESCRRMLEHLPRQPASVTSP